MYSKAGPILVIALLAACNSNEHAHEDAPTYYADAKPIIDESCASCHSAGGIAPFKLETLEDVTPYAALIKKAVEDGTMPPWQGQEGCNEYANDFSLAPADKETLIAWIDAGTPEGDMADETEVTEKASLPIDLLVTLPEPFTPKTSPDDYRCQLIEWPETETKFVTGIEVTPDVTSIVHHTIVYAVGADTAANYRALDEAEDGPGYTCFGGPNGESDNPFEDMTTQDLLDMMNAEDGESPVQFQRWIGAWVPGAAARSFPTGTGIRMEPGDLLIVQMHYNTGTADPAPDQSSIGFQLADSVEREAITQPLTDLGWVTEIPLLGEPMTIPKDAESTIHTTTVKGDSMFFSGARDSLGLAEDSPLMVHTVGHHMHQLGRTGYQELHKGDGSVQCLVDIPDWDFHWQNAFTLKEPVLIGLDDELVLECDFDNSQANQPIIDGARIQSREVAWGEGSTDEMCLSTVYLTAP
ncbi:MAG: monooxygenase [Rhodobacterales bacterium]|nr:monooxygenase [Rhodobacterales bacterium]